ncbi:MAG: hypothetical protein H6702_16030 [Myxococcales bacterium]|nr:hypothetical protein [Myxococcales bacterium]
MTAVRGWTPLVFWTITTLLALGGCAPEPQSSPGQHSQALEFRRLPGAESLPAGGMPPPDALPAERFEGAPGGMLPQACARQCNGDAACAWDCFFEVDDRVPEARRSEEADCLFCGRETGFLESPVLMVEAAGKEVTLTWTPVDEADDYVVHGVQWQTELEETAPLRSHTWRTDQTSLRVELAEGTWTFYVLAYRDQPKARSLRSNIVDLEL